MTEKRRHSRQRVLRTGKIIFAGGACVLDCTIKNSSQDGAMLRIANSIDVPDQFQLYEPGRLLLHEALVVHRSARLIGVTFACTRDIADSANPDLRYLKSVQ